MNTPRDPAREESDFLKSVRHWRRSFTTHLDFLTLSDKGNPLTNNDHRDMPTQIPILVDAILNTALALDSTHEELFGALGITMIDLLNTVMPTKEKRLEHFANWAAAVMGTLEKHKEPVMQ